MKRSVLAAAMSVMVLAAGCSAPAGNNNNAPAQQQAAQEKYTSLSQLAGKTIGVQTGTSMGDTVKEAIPTASVSQYRNYTFLIDALKKGEIAAFPGDDPVIREICAKDSQLTFINEQVDPGDFAFAFPKTEEGNKLLAEFNEYMTKIKSDGTLKQMQDKWTGANDDEKIVPDHTALPADKGTLKFATEGDYAPFDYFKDNKVVGLDIDIAINFCQEYGYGLEIYTMSFSEIIPSIHDKKYDFGGAGITVTDERSEQVNFSEPNYSGGTVFCVLK